MPDEMDSVAAGHGNSTDGESCGEYNWPVLCLFAVVIAAIGETT